jgi:hypothetical protein
MAVHKSDDGGRKLYDIETSVNNYHSKKSNIPEGRQPSSHLSVSIRTSHLTQHFEF